MSYFLGIDYGTGGAKACITDEEMNVKAYAFSEYEIITQNPGWSEHRIGAYWNVTCKIIRECIQKSGIDPHEIKGIANSCALPCMVLVDKNGEELCNPYNLMDRRATAQVERMKTLFGIKKLFAVSGNRIEDHPSLVNVLWEREMRPDVFSRIDKIHTIASYIKFRLTGVSDINYSEGPLYGIAYDIRTNKFDHDILEKIGIDPALLPNVSECECIIGHVTPEAAEQTGLVPGIPVAAGQADACAGWLGGGMIEPGDIQMNLGTCGNFGIIHKNTDFMDSMINIAYTSNSSSTYVVIPTTTTGGQTMRYMRDQFSPLEVAAEAVSGVSAFDLLNYEAEKVSPGCDGLVVLPYLMGERTPLWDNYARSVVFGLSLNHSKAHMVRGMMEGVAFALYHSFENLNGRIGKINYPIVMNEGGAKSRLWRKIITDVFAQPTVLLKNRVGAPYGDCLLAAKAVGAISDYSIAKAKAEYVEPMEPDMKLHDMYMDYYQLFNSLYDNLKDEFVKLSNLRNKYSEI